MIESSRTPTVSRASTVVWGNLEEKRFLKLPKMFAYLGRYDQRVGTEIQPRHLVLIIALAIRKFGDQPIRAYWEEIASGLGVRSDTLRRWAYELRDLGLLGIKASKSAQGRNRRNEFDIGPFIELLERADREWRQQQANRTPKEST